MCLSIYLSDYYKGCPRNHLRSVCIFLFLICRLRYLPYRQDTGALWSPYNDGEGNTRTLPLFGELVEAAFYYSDHAVSDASSPKQPPKFAPGANGARMARAPTGIELKEVMRQHGSSAGGQSLRSRPSRRLSFTGHLAGGDGVDGGRRLAETRTQKHRRANLPRRTSAFSSRHDDNV